MIMVKTALLLAGSTILQAMLVRLRGDCISSHSE